MATIDLRKYKYDTRIVAFIDILGFKQLVMESETDNSKFKILDQTLTHLKKMENNDKWGLKLIEIEEDAQRHGIEDFDIRKSVRVTCFSDSIVVSVQINKNNINHIVSALIANLSYIGSELMSNGILIRGGISVGNLNHTKDGKIIGKAMIEAYELESKCANYPRIILSDKLLKMMNYPYLTKKERFPHNQYIKRFDDGCVGFHQMIYYEVIQSSENLPVNRFYDSLKRSKETIINGLDSTFQNPKIYDKYKWLKNQYKNLIIKENLKEEFYDLNEGIQGNNIHYSHTNNYYNSKNNKE